MLAGYDAFQSRKRWIVTILSFMLASAAVVGIMVHIDSFSQYKWDETNNVGPATMVVSGLNVNYHANEISQIPGVEKAAPLIGAYARVSSMYKSLLFKSDFFVVVLTPEFIEAYPTIFNLLDGRFPESGSEIALDITIVDVLNVRIGDSVNYTRAVSVEPVEITLVGIFNHPEVNNIYAWHYKRGGGVVTPDRLSPLQAKTGYVYTKVDASIVNPSDPRGTFNRLYQVQEQIRSLDSRYHGPGDTSKFIVQDFLAEGISNYIEYLDSLRVAEMVRSGGVILLAILAGLLAIRFNINDRKIETNMLLARGASSTQVDRTIIVEILAQSLLAIPLGILLGATFSRVATAATGFFIFDLGRMFTQPFVISYDSLVVGAIVGLILPIMSLIALRTIYSAKSTVEEGMGRLAKISRGLSILRWDGFLLVFGILLLLTLVQAGELLSQFPILAMVIQLIPYVIFAGFASLATKGLRKGAIVMAKPFERVVGKIPAWVGIRRIAKEASSAGPTVMIFVLAMSIAYTSAIIDASLPYTNLNQSRLAISGDATFQLDGSHQEDWATIVAEVEQNNNSEAQTIVSVLPMQLSTGGAGTAKFSAVRPSEFKTVGYDYLGNPLDKSEMTEMLDILELQETGAIISFDLAEEYSLKEGDILRAFLANGSSLAIFEFQIIGVVQAIPDTVLSIGLYSYAEEQIGSYSVGGNRVLINRQYIENYLDGVDGVEYFLCIRTSTPEQSSALIDEIVSTQLGNAIYNNRYVSVMGELEEYIEQDAYALDRGIDTMLAVLTVVAIAGTFTVYATEGVKARSREIALLKAMGADNGLVVKSQAAEMMVLAFTSICLLGLYAPLLIVNSLISSRRTYGFSPFTFPIAWFVVIPWQMLLTLLAFFLTCFSVFIILIAVLGTRLSLASTLNASWTESSFVGGDE